MPSSALTVNGSGILEAGLEQRRDVGLLEVHHLVARRVVERRTPAPMSTRDELSTKNVFLSFMRDRVRGVARVEQLHRAGVDVHAIEVREVRVLALLAPDRREVQRRASSRPRRRCRCRRTRPRDLPDDLPLGVVEVVVPPAVALGPVDQLLAAGRCRRSGWISM